MDALTGRKRRLENDEAEDSKKRSKPSTSTSKEFIPDLYKSVANKKFRAQQPENEEERELIKSLPSDTETALLHLRDLNLFKRLFKERLPPIIIYSQLSAILSNQFLIDTQLSKLAKDNKILTFSTFTSSNYLIVFLQDFIDIKREGIFEKFVSQVVSSKIEASDGKSASEDLTVKHSLENSKYFSKESLRKRWKFEEDDIRRLVNMGYLGIQEGGLYCISLPGAGEFIKCFEKGKKATLGAIRRAKFGEILQQELEQRPMQKVAPLGVLYHIYDLIGSHEVDTVQTTSGTLLRAKKKS